MHRPMLFLGMLSSLVATRAHAFWGPERTSHMWDSTNIGTTGGLDCSEDRTNGAYTPGRKAGGWFEWRFQNLGIPTTFLAPDWSNYDATRQCPRTFNEYTTNHFHGVMNGRIATVNTAGEDSMVYAVYDTSGAYYHASKIKLQQDPSMAVMSANGPNAGDPPSTTINNQRSYSIAELARNTRKLRDVNPASKYFGTPSCPNVPATTACTSSNTLDSGFRFDCHWQANSGADHEGTQCAPPAGIETFDPDIDVRQNGNTVIAWTERYVEYTNYSASPKKRGIFPFQLPSAEQPTSTNGDENRPAWFPYRPLVVHVAMLPTIDLKGGNSASDSTGTPDAIELPNLDVIQYLSPGGEANEAGLNSASATIALQIPVGPGANYSIATKQAFSPRVTQVDVGGVVKPVVAWGETDYAFQTRTTNGFADKFYGPLPVVPPALPVATAGILYAKRWNSGTTWDDLYATQSAGIGTLCNLQEVSSGRASGRKRSFTGTHDIAVMRSGSPVADRPLIVMTNWNAALNVCELRVKIFNNGTQVWDNLGGDLRVGNVPSWPRVTVFENVPYVTWTEHVPGASELSAVYVARWNGSTWQRLGGNWVSAVSKDDENGTSAPMVRGPSIQVSHRSTLPFAPSGDASAAPVKIYVAYHELEGGWFFSNNATEGPWAAVARTCETKLTGTTWDCAIAPRAYSRSSHNFDFAYDQDVYNQDTSLGVSWGTAVEVDQITFNGLTGPKQLNDYTGNIYLPGKPSATDLSLSRVTERGEPNALYAGWPGPIQNHRAHDMGFYVRGDTPLRATRAQLSVGMRHVIAADTIALDKSKFSAGTALVKLWGSNGFGQLGQGNTTVYTTNVPKTVSFDVATTGGINKVVAGGLFSAVLTNGGDIYLWGDNTKGQVCNGTFTSPVTSKSLAPRQGAAPNNKWIDVSAGDDFVVALHQDGTVWACGNNASGQLGNNSTTTSFATWQHVKTSTTATGSAPFLSNITDVYAGGAFACARQIDRALRCWGSNSDGQLGKGTTVSSSIADATVKDAALVEYKFAVVALGAKHVLAKTDTYGYFSWGDNLYGQLAQGDNVDDSRPGAFSPASAGFENLVAGAYTSYGLAGTLSIGGYRGSLYAAGLDTQGQLGNDAVAANVSTMTAVDTFALDHVLGAFAGPSSSVVYAADYNRSADRDNETPRTWCWGSGTWAVCDGSATSIFVPELTSSVWVP